MAITIILLNRKRVQAQELAERLEVSLRTIYRDLDSLCHAGIPIVSYTGTEGGYEIMDSFRLDRQMLSFEELIALTTALRGLQSTQAMNRSDIDNLLDKVGALVSQAEKGRLADRDQIHIEFTPWRKSEADRSKYEALHKAVNENRLVHFLYTDGQGEETERRIEPMGLALKAYSWYLHGYCLHRQNYRTFRLSRIRELDPLDETFIRRPMPVAIMNQGWGGQRQQQQQPIELTLRFQAAAKVAVADHFEEKEIERLLDGSLLVRTTFPDEKWLIGFLLHFKSDLVILEPASIAAKVREAALAVSALYDEDGQAITN